MIRRGECYGAWLIFSVFRLGINENGISHASSFPFLLLQNCRQACACNHTKKLARARCLDFSRFGPIGIQSTQAVLFVFRFLLSCSCRTTYIPPGVFSARLFELRIFCFIHGARRLLKCAVSFAIECMLLSWIRVIRQGSFLTFDNVPRSLVPDGVVSDLAASFPVELVTVAGRRTTVYVWVYLYGMVWVGVASRRRSCSVLSIASHR